MRGHATVPEDSADILSHGDMSSLTSFGISAQRHTNQSVDPGQGRYVRLMFVSSLGSSGKARQEA